MQSIMAMGDELMVKDKRMGSAKFTHLRLMNSTFCTPCFRKHHFWSASDVSSGKADSKVLMMAIKLKFCEER